MLILELQLGFKSRGRDGNYFARSDPDYQVAGKTTNGQTPLANTKWVHADTRQSLISSLIELPWLLLNPNA
jgi:hypothetical protein